LLAVDVGGTFIKAAAVADGRIVGPVLRERMPEFLDTSGDLGEPGNARELDALAVDRAVFAVVEQASASLFAPGPVLVAGQMAGLAFIDDAGLALAPLISWQDTRFADVHAVEHSLGSAALLSIGDGIRVGSPIVTLSRIQRPPGSAVTSLIAYVAGRLAGSRSEVVHTTDAASWGLLDSRRLKWSKPACRVASVSAEELPRVSPHLEPVSEKSHVYCAVGDQQAALLGAGLEPGWLSVNLATGCQVSRIANDFSSGPGPDRVQTRPYFDSKPGARYLHTVTHLPGGRLLTRALIRRRGYEDWEWLSEHGMVGLTDAFREIVDGITAGARRLHAVGLPILFSGGVIQRLPGLQAWIEDALRAPSSLVYSGDDATLAGLAGLSTSVPESRLP
jgi:sugar (pentulose or hexulose) kinase